MTTKQTHTVATDALATLGTVIDETAGRDAIHLAVEPVVAGERLFPGDHVGRGEDGRWVRKPRAEAVGIVDPFLDVARVQEGERFWLVIYPRQITSLRHVWEHPAFAEAAPPTRSASETWMRAWAMRHMSADYYGERDFVSEDEAYASAIRAGEDHHVGPHESARDHIDSEWWGHWEAITGKRGQRGEYFSCGC